ncbi:MAG: hypothetical protein JJE30_00260 [Desulfuromonadales bacterium]|nr:hypothetical protein [Desulfuromonadales bacterium]
MAPGPAGPSRPAVWCVDAPPGCPAGQGGPAHTLPGRGESGRPGKLHRQRPGGGAGVSGVQGQGPLCRSLAAVCLLQRACHRGDRQERQRRHAAGRHQGPGQTGGLQRERLALCHLQVHPEAGPGLLHGGLRSHHQQLPSPEHPGRDARLPGGWLPVRVRLPVYDAFESATVAKTGVLNLPRPKESALGGHAVMAVGYDDKAKRFTVRNSWGPDWGKKGYFTMPYDYLADRNLSDDFWTVRQ